MTKVLLVLLGCVAAPGIACAQMLTAVCKDPTGYDYRVPLSERAAVEGGPDGFTGVAWSFSWVIGEPTGTVIVQSSKAAGGAPEMQRGPVVAALDAGIVSFVVPMTGALWTYSIYPAANVLMASRHTSGLPEHVAVGSIFHARCAVSVK